MGWDGKLRPCYDLCNNEEVVSAASMGMTSRRRMECLQMRKSRIQRFYFNDDSAVDELINEMNDWIAAGYLMKRFG